MGRDNLSALAVGDVLGVKCRRFSLSRGRLSATGWGNDGNVCKATARASSSGNHRKLVGAEYGIIYGDKDN